MTTVTQTLTQARIESRQEAATARSRALQKAIQVQNQLNALVEKLTQEEAGLTGTISEGDCLLTANNLNEWVLRVVAANNKAELLDSIEA